MRRIILLTGFAPFGGERSNPSWDVASRLQGSQFNGVAVKSMRLPVNCRYASRVVIDAITSLTPAAVVGLGQAGGRPVLSLERIAINLADPRGDHERDPAPVLRPRRNLLPDRHPTRDFFVADIL